MTKETLSELYQVDLQDHDHRGPASVHLLLKPPSFQW